MLSGKIQLLNNHTLNNLSKIFAILSVCILGYILIRAFLIKKDLPLFEQQNMTASTLQPSERILPSSHPFTEYSSALHGRNLFQLPKEKKIVNPKAVTEAPIQDLTKTFKIVGIMLSKDPRVIIQNLSTRRTNVLSVGDKLDDLIILDITKDKVIFERQGQRLELSLNNT